MKMFIILVMMFKTFISVPIGITTDKRLPAYRLASLTHYLIEMTFNIFAIREDPDQAALVRAA